MQLPAKNAGCTSEFHIGIRDIRGGVVTKTKFSYTDVLPYFLTHGALRPRAEKELCC